jgi:transposase
MRFVSKKSAETQALVMTHKAREILVRQLTQIINALRAHPGAFGIVAPKGVPRVGRLLETGARAALPECACLPLRLLADRFFATRDRIDMRTKEIRREATAHEVAIRLQTIPGLTQHRDSPGLTCSYLLYPRVPETDLGRVP